MKVKTNALVQVEIKTPTPGSSVNRVYVQLTRVMRAIRGIIIGKIYFYVYLKVISE